MKTAVSSDHPHACGENSSRVFRVTYRHGPSPRMWGEPHPMLLEIGQQRTIPTHVGRTSLVGQLSPAGPDHPHACGENRMTASQAESRSGPSPRMWGELAILNKQLVPVRTIPTHVGRTTKLAMHLGAETDHPHACGENQAAHGPPLVMVGPSPRMWGEHHLERRASLRSRTIPTHVGRTTVSTPPMARSSDHPHACGENVTGDTSRSRENGPSPRMWGEH